MKVFLDANVLIDVVQNRIDFVETSSKVLQLGLDGECELCASDITFTTVSFYARKNRTQEQLYEVLQSLRDFIDVAPSGKIAIDWALQQKSKDFEDSFNIILRYVLELNILFPEMYVITHIMIFLLFLLLNF